MRKIASIVLAICIFIGLVGCEENVKTSIVEDDNLTSSSLVQDRAYQYNENEGIFIFYETDNKALYRELLPDIFELPEKLIVHLFVMDFYDIDSDAEPYKEMSISLLAEYEGEEVWHCIYMPVTSEQSMIAGRVGLGLPKTVGEITFDKSGDSYHTSVKDHLLREALISIDIIDEQLEETERETIKAFMDLPKLNIINGEVIQMTRTGGSVNIIEIAEKYPKFVQVMAGEAFIAFDNKEEDDHPFGLKSTKIVAAYFLHNEIPFSLDRAE